jgi:hypothetical protein
MTKKSLEFKLIILAMIITLSIACAKTDLAHGVLQNTQIMVLISLGFW